MNDLTAYWNFLLVHPIMSALVLAYGLFKDFGFAIVLVSIAVPTVLFVFYRDRATNVARGSLPLFVQWSAAFPFYMVYVQYRLFRARGNNSAMLLLPLLVEMPVLTAAYLAFFSALVQVPSVDGEQLRQTMLPFVPMPIEAHGFLDLTAHWMPWMSACPIVNTHTACGLGAPDPWHLLPVLVGLTQLVASIMARPMTQAVAGEPQPIKLQLMVVVPLLLVFISWSLPSGLALFYLTTVAFQIVQRYLVSGWGQLPRFVPLLARVSSPAEPVTTAGK